MYWRVWVAASALFVCAAHAEAVRRLVAGYGFVPPLSYTDPNGKPAGFAIDVLNAAATREGIELVWKRAGTSRQTEQAIADGALDLIPAAMVTRERQRQFYVSEPWWFAGLSLLVRTGGPVRTASDLAGTRIALASTTYDTLAERHFPGAAQLPQVGASEAAEAVCTGVADAALMTQADVTVNALARPAPCRALDLSSVETDAVIELAVMSPRSKMAIARRLRRRIDEMALDGTLTALAPHHPPTPVSGALRLAQTLRESYELRIAYVVVASVLVVLVAGIFFLMRQRRIHAALQTSETRYRLMVEANPVGFIHAALGGPGYGRLHHVNQAFLDMTGFSRAELESGKVSLASLTPREWFPADARAVEEARCYGRSKLYEKEYVRKDGTRAPLLAACAAVDERNMVAFAIDISERRRLERQVKWLSGMVPICAACKRIRDEEGHWQELESYMTTRISADFSHGICPACLPLYDL